MSGNKTALKSSDYVHLHNHTQYSLLDGLTKISPLVDFVKQNDMSAVAMTDHGTLSGAIEFYKEAKSKNIKPIIGLETYIATRKHTDKDPTKDKNRFHLILLATNEIGYKNLMRLSTIANLEGFYYFPRIDHELLEKYNEGLIALSACMGGEIGSALKENQDKKAEEIAVWYKQIFGDRYYLEIQDHGHPKNPLHSKEQENINNKVLALGKKLAIPVVVTCDAHYLKHSDQDAHEILLCVGTGSYLTETKRMSLKDFPLHVVEPSELIKRWGNDHPEVIKNTKTIADRCNLKLELGKILIPKFDVPENETEKSYLEKLVYRGLAFRYGGIKEKDSIILNINDAKQTLPKSILQRAQYELGVIESMGFNGYFLIIWDFIKWGKDKGIVFGPGRGSAAGSIISYALRITELDPIVNGLLFERFLNPDRISMPDIDIDIQDTRRDEVIQYCVEKYGDNKVANIVTFGRMAARAAVRDVARVLEVPYSEADRLAKMIPPPVQGRHIPLEVSIKENQDLKNEYNNNLVAKQVFDMAIQLEGTVRSHGVHAAGVVIAPDDIVSFIPLEKAQKGVIATQYPMGPVEDLGLLKMDFLGLSNLTTIKNALRIIKKVYDKDIDIGSIPLDDNKTYQLLGRSDTTGVFQLESAGMKRYLKQLKPTVFDDIVAMVALYRPGPMQFIDDFLARKNGSKQIEYMHPKMEGALKSTYGVLVYQEQFMQISKDLAGFTGGQADTLRKAVGKKNMELMKKVKPQFIEGAIKFSNADKKLMEKFWQQLEEFANYCFNKSHAACYALIAYWTAYLKAHYPAAFMAALMTSDMDNIDRLAIEIAECKHMGINVLPPDINESYHEFAVVLDNNQKTAQIRFGMDAIKNVGHGAVAEIIAARDAEGAFTSLSDFITRVNGRLINKKVWESLIKCGAMDRFGDRSALLENIDIILATGSKISKERSLGQTDLFGNSDEKVKKIVDIDISHYSGLFSDYEFLQWERELLGLYLSRHPLENYELILSEKTVKLSEIQPNDDKKQAVVGGTINSIRKIITKNGLPMAFVKIEDIEGNEVEIIIFPNTYKDTEHVWIKDKVVIISGRVNTTDKEGNDIGEIKILASKAQIIDPLEAKNYRPKGKKVNLKNPTKKKIDKNINIKDEGKIEDNTIKRLYVRIQSTNDDMLLLKLKSILEDNLGDFDAVLVIGDAKKQIIKLPQKVGVSDELLKQLKNEFGDLNIKFQ